MATPLLASLKANLVLYGALTANVGIAVAKFIAAAVTGSSSMLTEGVHSLVDSGNQVLLLYGQRRAERPANERHAFGYGRELYFWAFVVAILIFAVGAGVSIYEGWTHIRYPEPLRNPTVNYVVLAVAGVLEGSSWAIAVRELNTERAAAGWWSAVRRSKDPTTFIVLFEDSAALLGLAIAAAGVFLSHALQAPWLDGAASILIGLILALVAALLASEAKGLLIGESADPALVAGVWNVVEGASGVVAVNHVRTIHTAPESIFAAISADFEDTVPVGEIEVLIERMEERLKGDFPQLSSIYIRPEKAELAIRQSRPEVGQKLTG